MGPPTPNPVTNTTAFKDFVAVHHDTYPAISTSLADLSGKSVLITGASKGVGLATAVSFAAAGASKIAIAARSDLSSTEAEMRKAAKEAKRAEPEILAVKLDVVSEEAVQAVADKISAAFGGKLDVLINNAGYLENWVRIADSQPDDWWRSWEINLKGAYLCTRAFLPLVLASETKLVVNMSSIGAHNIAYGASAYQTSRFATCRFNEFVAREYGPDGVVAIAMHPGGVKTDLALGMPDYMHAILQDEPALPADFLVWLARERREWLSGRLVSAEWDVEALEARRKEIEEKDLLKFRMVL